MAAVYTQKGGKNFISDALAGAVSLEGCEGFSCHCRNRICQEVLAQRYESLTLLTSLGEIEYRARESAGEEFIRRGK
jgi:hypothetical protein